MFALGLGLGFFAGCMLAVVLLAAIGRRSTKSGPNSRVRVREGVVAVLTKGAR